MLWFSALASHAYTNYYVATNGPGGGFTNWATAASNIQQAIDVTLDGDTVYVSNGVYNVGGVTNFPVTSLLTTRVAITKAITVQSFNNDPTNTIIQGAWDPVTTNGPAAVRCVYIVQNASLIGFTITNGAGTTSGGYVHDQYSGAIYAPSAYANVSNCIITGNSGYIACIYSGARLLNCLIRYNTGPNGGEMIKYGILSNCVVAFNKSFATYVSGLTVYNSSIVSNVSFWVDGSYTVSGGTVYNSIIGWNSGAYYCGGAGGANVYNCLIIGNSAGMIGGVWGGTARNCTVVGNKNNRINNYLAGGVGYGIYLTNCIVWGNTNAGGANYQNIASAEWVQMTNCCTTPAIPGDPAGAGFITNNPLFVTQGSGFGTTYVLGNLRLSSSSPCVNTGTNAPGVGDWPDLDGRTRIRYGTVDMGCYERIYSGTIFTGR